MTTALRNIEYQIRQKLGNKYDHTAKYSVVSPDQASQISDKGRYQVATLDDGSVVFIKEDPDVSP